MNKLILSPIYVLINVPGNDMIAVYIKYYLKL